VGRRLLAARLERAEPRASPPRRARRLQAAAEAIRLVREKEEETERLAALELEQKAKRDARYAARKKKKR
jgi:hypothetical protein